MGNVKWDVRNGAEYWKREMGSEDCECSHHTSHMASEKWEVGLKRGFPFLKYPTQAMREKMRAPLAFDVEPLTSSNFCCMHWTCTLEPRSCSTPEEILRCVNF